MTPMERAAAMAEKARDKLKSNDWSVQRKGEQPWHLHLSPAQDFAWVAAHYPGASIVQGKPK
jgi:hypothetical protein